MSQQHQQPTSVVYRRENLSELTAAVVMQHLLDVHPINIKSETELKALTFTIANECVTVFGSYYKKQEF
jgi:hypothetical protein